MINKRRMRCAIFCALAVSGVAQAEKFQIESAVIDSVSGKELGVVRENGGVSEFFKAQKKMMFEMLNSAGIDFKSLPVDVRGRLEKFQTVNLEAFKAFSQGLDLMDEGKYAEAHAFFEKATQLDPNFKLAEDKKVAMPDVNVSNTVQLRSVIRDNAKTAVGNGMSKVQVDLGQALAAMQSGQTVVMGASTTPQVENKNSSGSNYTANQPGSGAALAPRKVVGVAFSYTSNGVPVGIASSNEWATDQYTASGSALQTVGTGSFVAQKSLATAGATQAYTLTDGSAVYWGTWQSTPGASASVIVSGTPLSAPVLGSQVQYMMGDATRAMPTSGTAVFLPVAGFLTNTVGNMSVNFTTRQVAVNNLGFTSGAVSYAGLNGVTSYSTAIASGFFKGNFSSGTCAGCSSFSPAASVYTGNFVGAAANGVIVSTIMQNGAGTVSGVHLLAR